jgi:hypothetical protein
MTIVAAPLGVLAFLNMLATSCCAIMPADPSICYGGREVPKKAPEQPAGCHATLGCAEHRKPRGIAS